MDSTIIKLLRERKFSELLSFSGVSGICEFDALDKVYGEPPSKEPTVVERRVTGILITEYDGTIRAWLSHLPQGTLVIEETAGA